MDAGTTGLLNTIVVVGIGAAVQLIQKILSDRSKATALKVQHDWDAEDREAKNQAVLGAIEARAGEIRADVADNTKISTEAVEVNNHVHEKLAAIEEKVAAVLPSTATILANMLKVNSAVWGIEGAFVSPADVGRVLVEMRQQLTDLEKYAHDSVHRLNNIIAAMQAKERIAELHVQGEV